MWWFYLCTARDDFKQALLTGVTFWMEKRKCCPIHKNSDKHYIKNYCPVFFKICGKIVERLTFNEMFNYFSVNKLIPKSQSGFQPGDSCINQLLSITHEIFTSFDNELQVRSALLT